MKILPLIQPALVKAVGQQLLQREALALALSVQADHRQVGCELHHHLPAGAAGHAVILAAPGDHNGVEVPVSLTDRLDHGRPFGAYRGAVGGVLHVAAGEYCAVLAQQRRAHREVGIGYIGTLQHGHRHITKLFFRHGASSFDLFRFLPCLYLSSARPYRCRAGSTCPAAPAAPDGRRAQ